MASRLMSVDSGELPTAVGLSRLERNSIYPKWQRIACENRDSAEPLLKIIKECDEQRYWEDDSMYQDRESFLRWRVLINFDVYDKTIPEILSRLRRGEVPPLKAHGGSVSSGPRPATVEKAERVRELRAQGKTQQEVAEEVGVSRNRVSEIEGVDFQDDAINSKTDTDPTPKPTLGTTGVPYTIARLRRDGFEELAGQVEEGSLTAAEARRRAGISPPLPSKREKALKLLKALSDEDREWVLSHL